MLLKEKNRPNYKSNYSSKTIELLKRGPLEGCYTTQRYENILQRYYASVVSSEELKEKYRKFMGV